MCECVCMCFYVEFLATKKKFDKKIYGFASQIFFVQVVKKFSSHKLCLNRNKSHRLPFPTYKFFICSWGER